MFSFIKIFKYVAADRKKVLPPSILHTYSIRYPGKNYYQDKEGNE